MYKVRATYVPRDGMRFDLDYYFRVHVPLARRQAAGKLRILKIEVETGAVPLMQPDARLSPCVFCIYLRDRDDVEAFRRFLTSADTDPMRRDVPAYTNCDLEWAVCEVHEV
jgi:hypothetical protein